MYFYLLVCRSLTYAQRALRVLERAGIRAYVVRTTRDTAQEGCGYSVKVRENSALEAIDVLKSAGLPPRRILKLLQSGETEEVKL